MQCELLAVVGRRRVGKTFLIKNFYKQFDFECTAIPNADINDQLLNFHRKLVIYSVKKKNFGVPKNWIDSFYQLQIVLGLKKSKKKKVLFIDELPWMETSRSKFVDALAHFCNDYAVHSNVLLIICGSAASWLIQKIVLNKGGLHNRITQLINLKPFTLIETEEFLKYKCITYNRQDIATMYMINGGIPLYLNEYKKGLSIAQNVDLIWFNKNGILYNEFEAIFTSLFFNPQNHISFVRALATKRKGLTRVELLFFTKIEDGGSVTKTLQVLIAAGFITLIFPFGKSKKDSLHRLTDAYRLYYLQFIEKHKKLQTQYYSICKLQLLGKYGVGMPSKIFVLHI